MTAEQEQARKQAGEDLLDIDDLKKNVAFNRYWLRQLRAKAAKVRDSFENDPPDKVDKDEREILRRLLKAYEELERMPAQHAASAHALLTRNA